MDWFINRCRGQSIWIDISVVRFLPLSFYAKKKVAERKARIRGIAPRYAALLFGAVSPLYIPLMTAQPIATVSVYTRNGRQALSLPFLKDFYHACCFSFSLSQNAYTLNCNWDKRLNSIWLKVYTPHTAVKSKSAVFPLSAVRALLSAYQFRTFSAGGIISKIKTSHALTQI